MGFSEEADHTELPIPWNPYYKDAWHKFLKALADRYGSRTEFVSIAVAGPTASGVNCLDRESAFMSEAIS